MSCRAGTFIIRPSESQTQDASDYHSYTLLIRSKNQIEKLRVERHQSGRLRFGNRMFDSVSDLFSRYKTAEIRPGTILTLFSSSLSMTYLLI